jgi:Nif-specific regulatory protein
VLRDFERQVDHLRRERDFLLRLLELGDQPDLRGFLDEALSLVMRLTEARKGYIEVDHDLERAERRFWIARGWDAADGETRPKALSRGIIGACVSSGSSIQTNSALEDERFDELASVTLNRIQEVLCAPVGSGIPMGVVYLQGCRDERGFTEDDCRYAELFARHLAPFVDRLQTQMEAENRQDPTAEWRTQLKLQSIIGRSLALAEVFKKIRGALLVDFPVLITGPSGSGKTSLAQAIHLNSERAAHPFHEVSCANIPEALLEAELFGAKKGAYTGIDQDRDGLVRAANRGTLFLDEIGELTPGAQSKLLRFLQSGTYTQLGSTEAQSADVRVLAATHVDLEDAIARKSFREDLYYRLNVLQIRMPSLAERREDIELLAEHILGEVLADQGLPQLRFSPSALASLETADWPGNIRQLENVIKTAAVAAVSEGAEVIGRHHTFDRPRYDEPTDPFMTLSFQDATRQAQRRIVREVLNGTDWNVTEAAKRLDVARSYLYKLIKSFGLQRNSGD